MVLMVFVELKTIREDGSYQLVEVLVLRAFLGLLVIGIQLSLRTKEI